jgi:hypothetical protein
MTDAKQIELLRAIIAQKRIDAWDLGFERVLSPLAIDEALRLLIARFGIDGARRFILPMTKAARGAISNEDA